MIEPMAILPTWDEIGRLAAIAAIRTFLNLFLDRDMVDVRERIREGRVPASLQRTRMSADRTLMSVIRTSISLIGFGFTIFQFFEKLRDASVLKNAAAPRRFGEALVYLGIGMLILGIAYHVMFMRGLREERARLKAQGLIHAESGYPFSLTLIVAVLLLVVGILAGFSMAYDAGPFG